jgi:branched-subunit amino acid permease
MTVQISKFPFQNTKKKIMKQQVICILLLLALFQLVASVGADCEVVNGQVSNEYNNEVLQSNSLILGSI